MLKTVMLLRTEMLKRVLFQRVTFLNPNMRTKTEQKREVHNLLIWQKCREIVI